MRKIFFTPLPPKGGVAAKSHFWILGVSSPFRGMGGRNLINNYFPSNHLRIFPDL